MATIKICDRCGEPMSYDGGLSVIIRRGESEFGAFQQSADLCPRCYNELRKFLNIEGGLEYVPFQ